MSAPASTTSTPVCPTPTTATPKSRPRRESRFTEGSPVAGHEVLTLEPANNELFFTILQQMDEHEKRRRHRDSNTSTESFNSHDSYNSPHSSAEKLSSPTQAKEDKRRSITFGRRASTDLVRRSMDAQPGERSEPSPKGFKGRLRALTGGRERSGKPYTGT